MRRQDIVDAIYRDFAAAYQGFASFVDNGYVWTYCIEAIQNLDMINRIISANRAGTPPAATFMNENANRINWQLSGRENQEVGAFWGFVFQNVLNFPQYRDVNVSVPNNTMKTAALFEGRETDPQIIA